MATPNLNLSHITGSQSNKETTANVAFDGLDNAMNSILDLTITGNRTLTSAQFRGAFVFRLNGSTPGAFAFNVPAVKRVFAVINVTGSDCLIGAGGSQSVSLATGETGLFYCDTDDVYQLGLSGSAGGSGSGTTVTTVAGNRTISNSDLSGDVILKATGGSAHTFTVESGLTGTEPVTIIQSGLGQVTFDEGSGVSIIEPDGEIKTRTKGSVCQLIPLGSDTYILVGDLTTP